MEFKKYKLCELASVDISSVDKKSKEGEKPVRLCNFTDVYKNWAITKHHYSSLMKATAKDRDIEKFCLRKGQVAITKDSETRDDIGIPTYIADDFEDVVLGYHCALITPNENLDGKYLNAYLNSKMAKKYFEGYASGSGQRYTLTLDSINEIQIWAPDIDSQREVAKILSDLDKKISLNTRMNAELEAMAKQLYDYWFVQFDFPDENGKPYKSSGGKMVYDEKLKREIPEGWEVQLIGSILDKVQSTPRIVTDEYLDDGLYPIIDQTTDVYFAGFTNREDSLLLQYPAIVFGDHSCAVKYINFPFARGADGTQIMLSKNENVSIEYMYFYVKNINIGKGYARHYSFVKDYPIIIPSSSPARNYNKIAEELFLEIKQLRFENKKLTRLRDSLLPMLMNGQVTIE